MAKIRKILNTFMGCCLAYYVGHCIFVIWNHARHPEFYGMQSAPWYTSLWVNGIIVLVIVGICSLIKYILNYIERNKKKKP